MSKLQAIRYERGKLELLDQRLLPLESIYIPIRTPQEAFDAIRSMVVRGAPAIGCTAALAVAAWLVERGAGSQYDSAAAAADDVQATTQHLVQRCAGCTRQPSPCLTLPEQQETMTPAVAMWNNRPRPYLRRTMLSYPVCACGLSACLQLRSPVTGTWTVVRIEAAVSLQQARHHSQKQIVAQCVQSADGGEPGRRLQQAGVHRFGVGGGTGSDAAERRGGGGDDCGGLLPARHRHMQGACFCHGSFIRVVALDRQCHVH